jgi:hypothetical protein
MRMHVVAPYHLTQHYVALFFPPYSMKPETDAPMDVPTVERKTQVHEDPEAAIQQMLLQMRDVFNNANNS